MEKDWPIIKSSAKKVIAISNTYFTLLFGRSKPFQESNWEVDKATTQQLKDYQVFFRQIKQLDINKDIDLILIRIEAPDACWPHLPAPL